MNVSRATRLWMLGLLAALSAAACEAVDHTVGEGTNDELLNPSGGGDNPAGGDDNGEGGSHDAEGGGGIWADGSVSAVVNATTGGNQTGPAVTGAGGGGTGTGPAVTGAGGGGTGTGPAVTGAGGAGSRGNVSVNASSGGGVAAASETDGGGNSEGAWGDLPIPDTCTEVNLVQDFSECELEVDCEGTPVTSHCFAVDGFLECQCPSVSGGVEFQLSGVALSDACPHMLAACLNWPELELECVPPQIVDEPDYCTASASCTGEGVIGNADFTGSYNVAVLCRREGSDWRCSCGDRFTLPTATDDPPCLDARGWCASVGVEPIGNRSCSLVSASESGDTCRTNLECQRAVTLSGREGTMYEDEWIECALASSGVYQCNCGGEGQSTAVAAEDPASACAATVSLCDRE